MEQKNAHVGEEDEKKKRTAWLFYGRLRGKKVKRLERKEIEGSATISSSLSVDRPLGGPSSYP